MSYHNSGSTTIHDSHFTSARNIYQSYSLNNAPNDPFELLKHHSALDASFDSDARFDPPKCHPETRLAVLEHIQQWAKSGTSPVIWIRGAAGAGKSAIAQTLSESWDEDSMLAASFYFSRTVAGRNEKRRFVSTLAYQIATTIPATRPLIEDVIRSGPQIFDRNLRTQVRRLIVNPLASVWTTIGPDVAKPRLIVIDGLDECCVDHAHQDHEQQQKEILESLRCALEHPGFPLRFVVASRPERQIRDIFDHGVLKSSSCRVVLDDLHNPSADIELYLRCKLQEIQKKHPYLSVSWPGEDVIMRLVAKSSGHFIYAAVVIRYLSTPRMDPEACLKAVIWTKSNGDRSRPFAELDAVYTHILASVAGDSLPTVMALFHVLLELPYPLFRSQSYSSDLFPLSAANFLCISLGQLYVHLTDLHSILNVPSLDHAEDTPITFFHASFGEYLKDESRSGYFCVDEDEVRQQCLELCLRHLFIQVLSPNAEHSECYCEAGFAKFFGDLLEYTEPTTDILEGMRALLGEDESQFTEYARRANLDGWGTTRRSMEIIRELYDDYGSWDWPENSNTFELPFVLRVLKRFPQQGFMPIDPTTLIPELGHSEEFKREWNSHPAQWESSLVNGANEENHMHSVTENGRRHRPPSGNAETPEVATSALPPTSQTDRQGFGRRITDLLC